MPNSDYNAPALEKGLALLEFMAGKTTPFTIAELATAMGRSKTEIYRVLITLENRGYIRREGREGRYEMTGLLFSIGIRHPPRHQLVDVAVRHMENLSRRTHQSCQISVMSGDDVVVVRAQSAVAIGFTVQVGFRVPLLKATSGRLLYAFNTRHQQALWLNMMRKDLLDRAALREFLADVDLALRQGYLIRPSTVAGGIVGISVPIFARQSPIALACLAIPYVSHPSTPTRFEDALPLMMEASAGITRDMD